MAKSRVGAFLPHQAMLALALGIVSQLGQVVFLRELLMIFHGSELAIGLILAAWMFWVGVGSYWGARVADRARRPRTLVVYCVLGIMLMLPVTILFIRAWRGFLDILPGAYISLPYMVMSSFLLTAPVSLLLGFQFVLIARLWREREDVKDNSGASQCYSSEAAGNMVGGVVFTFYLVQFMNSMQVVLLAGMLMAATALVLVWPTGASAARQERDLRPLLTVALGLSMLVLPFTGQIDSWAYELHWQRFAPQHRLVAIAPSKHGTIAVAQLKDQYSFFQSGNLLFSIAGAETAVPGLEEQEAVSFAHLAMTQHRQPREVLLIGGGLRGMLGEILKHPVQRIDYIELDEALTRLARQFVVEPTLLALSDPRVNLVHTDGRLFVKTAVERYDIIIVDTPDPSTAAMNRFYTQEFFRETASLLNPGGVLVIGVTSTPDLRSTALANRNATIYHTLKSVFAEVLVAGERVMHFIAAKEPGHLSLDIATLQERFLARGIETVGFSSLHFALLLEEVQVRRLNWIIRNHGRSRNAELLGPQATPLLPATVAEQQRREGYLPPVRPERFINSDLRPIGYFYTLMFWEELTPHAGRTLLWLLHIQQWWVLPLCVVPLLWAGKGRLAPKPSNAHKAAVHFAVLFAVFAAGLSTMALQIALLFSFQSFYGYIFEMVGLIVAVFMCGLATGAYASHRLVKNKGDIFKLANVQLFIAVIAGFLALLLPAVAELPRPAVVSAIFFLSTFISGLANGLGFPIAIACFRQSTPKTDKDVGVVYGVELFGSCLGAIVASVAIAPIFGIVACCLLAMLVSITAFIALRLSGRDERCPKTALLAKS